MGAFILNLFVCLFALVLSIVACVYEYAQLYFCCLDLVFANSHLVV